MSRTITLTVSDEVYAALQRRAKAVGTSLTRIAATSLEQQFGHAGRETGADRSSDAAEQRAAGRQLAQHFGTVDLGRATGADNESIDADLAMEHAGTHEPA